MVVYACKHVCTCVHMNLAEGTYAWVSLMCTLNVVYTSQCVDLQKKPMSVTASVEEARHEKEAQAPNILILQPLNIGAS